MSDPIKEVEEAPKDGRAYARRLSSWIDTYPKAVLDWFLAQVTEQATQARAASNTANTHRARAAEAADEAERSATTAAEVVRQIGDKLTLATQQADRAALAKTQAEAQVPLATAQAVAAGEQATRAQRIADEIRDDLTAPEDAQYARRGRVWEPIVAPEGGGGRKVFNWDQAFRSDNNNFKQPGHHNLGFWLELTDDWPVEGYGGFAIIDEFNPPDNHLYIRFYRHDPAYDEPLAFERIWWVGDNTMSDWIERPRAPTSFIPAQASLRIPGIWKSTCSFSGDQSTQALSRNRTVLVPYVVPYDMEISHLGVDITNSGVGGYMGLMCYDSDPKTGVPRNRIGYVLKTWTNAGIIKGQLSSSVILKRGQTYWFGFLVNNPVTVRAQLATQSWGLGTEFGMGNELSAYWSTVAPDTQISDVTISDFTNQINVPIIYFKLKK